MADSTTPGDQPEADTGLHAFVRAAVTRVRLFLTSVARFLVWSEQNHG